MGMSSRTPDGVLVERPRSVDVMSLSDAWSPLVTVLVTAGAGSRVVWIDPLVCTVALGAARDDDKRRRTRTGVTRMFRNPGPLVVGQPWTVEALYDGDWGPLHVGCVDEICVVRFDEPVQP
jgi:hypothetical protein